MPDFDEEEEQGDIEDGVVPGMANRDHTSKGFDSYRQDQSPLPFEGNPQALGSPTDVLGRNQATSTPVYEERMVSGNGSNGRALLEVEAKGDLYPSKAVKVTAPVVGNVAAQIAEKRRVARLKGYEGDPCGNCGAFTLVRNGVCMKCDTCGETTGCS
jgi:ribonucleoside-diphosphate reductase alpha chain